MSGRKRSRWTQFSIKGILLATLLVATFYSGRLSHQLEVDRAKQNQAAVPPIVTIQSGSVKYLNLGNNSSLRSGTVFELFDLPKSSPPESEIPDSIEQGMKATELEMQERFRGFR